MRSSIVKTLKKYGHSTFELTEASQPDAKKNEWKTYRQALRDITKTTPADDALSNITWPTKPE